MMNNTCISLKHMGLWSRVALASFAPAYPSSIRGTNDNEQEARGTE